VVTHRKSSALLLAFCLSGTGCNRSLPTSDFTVSLRKMPGQLVPDIEVTFGYLGSSELEDLDLEFFIDYPNGVRIPKEGWRWKIPGKTWAPKTEKCVRLPENFLGKADLVTLTGTAKIGDERVKVNVSWRPQ